MEKKISKIKTNLGLLVFIANINSHRLNIETK